jgi:hypothetical protein
MREQEQSWIKQLNRQAKLYKDAGLETYDAIAQAAADLKLHVLVDGDSCRIYEAPDGIFVNCWIDESDSTRIKDGSSFDNSIQWYTGKAV